jgi:hypothetical protein
MKRLGSLWEKVSKDKGVKFFTGYFENTKVVMFANNKKNKETDPDWIVYEEEKK